MPKAWILTCIGVLLAVPCNAQASLLATSHSGVCFLDIDGDGARNPGDPTFLQAAACSQGPTAGDIRITGSSRHAGGTIILGTDGDVGRRTVARAGQYAFSDNDGNGVYSPSDPIFLAFGPLPGTLAVGDVPLTGATAFASLAPQDARAGAGIQAAPVAIGGEVYAEADGQNGFTTGDVVYLDMDASGSATIGDLRLASGPSSHVDTNTTTEPTSSNTTTAPASPPSIREPSSSPSASPPRADTRAAPSRAVPGVPILAAIGVMALAAGARRARPA
ncbi:MAG TPA: hypothetical protein VM286_00770 [Candidatus Thermoplasmatota archaeon]|nr:hypothetical protein [Candidatus Thermoplasmatota archaeon]